MEALSGQEQQWLRKMRTTRDRLYIGIDHHGAQLTIAWATGQEVLERSGQRGGFSWVPSRVFAQDGIGYEALLDHLAATFPGIARKDYLFLSEPSYAKPCSQFLLNAGFERSQVLWVDVRKVSQYRKSHHLSAAGKNDADDARAMVAMLFGTISDPAAPIRLFEVPPIDQTAEALGYLAEEHRRLSDQGVRLQNKIFQKVLLLLPEARRIWGRTEKAKRPDGGEYTKVRLELFETQTPLRVLHAFPTAAHLASAGFDGIWKQVGGRGVRKAPLVKLIQLAATSAGIGNDLWARQLQLLIEEYWELRRRQEAYELEMTSICREDLVLASLEDIKFLSIQGVAAIVGALGDVSKFKGIDQAKKYLNIAPQPMPQSGDVDEHGRPIQRWRLPANTYETLNGQKRIKYKSSGRKDIRLVGYLWFHCLVQGNRRIPDDPFARLYTALKESHEGRPRWLGRVRWKVIAKLIETIYYCLKNKRPYDPGKVIINVLPSALQAA